MSTETLAHTNRETYMNRDVRCESESIGDDHLKDGRTDAGD